jgi:endonuclease/exonuclease/phosphatase family metal-dependent hydrolase
LLAALAGVALALLVASLIRFMAADASANIITHAVPNAKLDAPETLHILQQNCWTPLFGGGRDRQKRMEALVAEAGNYDVLLLQELFSTWLAGWRVAGYAEWLVAELVPRGFTHFLIPGAKFLQMQDSGLFIASKVALTGAFEVVYNARASSGEMWTSKGALGVRLRSSNLVLVNTHLNAYEGAEERAARRSQLLQLKEQLPRNASVDALVAGDFNVNALSNGCSNQEYTGMIQLLQPLAPLGNVCNYTTWPSDASSQRRLSAARYTYILHHNPRQWQIGAVEPVQIGAMFGEGYRGISDHLGLHVKAFLNK